MSKDKINIPKASTFDDDIDYIWDRKEERNNTYF